MSETAKKCAHPGCVCTIRDGDKYCSPYCHDAGSHEQELACDCGHSGCRSSQPTKV